MAAKINDRIDDVYEKLDTYKHFMQDSSKKIKQLEAEKKVMSTNISDLSDEVKLLKTKLSSTNDLMQQMLKLINNYSI